MLILLICFVNFSFTDTVKVICSPAEIKLVSFAQRTYYISALDSLLVALAQASYDWPFLRVYNHTHYQDP